MFDIKPGVVYTGLDTPIPSKVIVSIRENIFMRDRTACHERTLFVRKSLSSGFDFFTDDIAMTGIENVLPRITNFHEVAPGLYEIVMTDFVYDRDFGHIEEWNYELRPYNQNEN